MTCIKGKYADINAIIGIRRVVLMKVLGRWKMEAFEGGGVGEIQSWWRGTS